LNYSSEVIKGFPIRSMKKANKYKSDTRMASFWKLENFEVKRWLGGQVASAPSGWIRYEYRGDTSSITSILPDRNVTFERS